MSWQGDLRELVTVVHDVNCANGYVPTELTDQEWHDDLRTPVNLVEQMLADEYTCTHGHRA